MSIGTASKIGRSLEALKARIGKLRKQGKKIVFTNGCFDLLHAGHVETLEGAKALGDILIVGLNSDSSIRKLKGHSRPLLPLKHRLRTLAGLQAVDYVIAFNSLTPIALIRELKPDVLVKGQDWNSGDIVGSEYAGKVARIRLIPGLSTTAIIRKIKKQEG